MVCSMFIQVGAHTDFTEVVDVIQHLFLKQLSQYNLRHCAKLETFFQMIVEGSGDGIKSNDLFKKKNKNPISNFQ